MSVTRIRAFSAISAGVLAGLSSAAACGASALFLVDFEDLDEETAISDQYADLGVLFSIQDHGDELPIIAVEGTPTVAYTGIGADAPMSSGVGGLTDPLIDGEFSVGRNVVMTFDPPVTNVRLFIIDIDTGDVMTLRAFDGETEVDAMTVSSGDPGTGNGQSTAFFVSGDAITSAVMEVPLDVPTGWAMDFVIFTRPCEGAECGPQIRISQESASGLGDFDDHILGNLLAWPLSASAVDFYAYGVPEGSSWNGPWLTPEADRSHLLFANTEEGMSLFIVHDRAIPDDPDGGKAEMVIELFNDEDGAERVLEDDPPSGGIDSYTGEPGEMVFTSQHSWDSCCTDGMALTALAFQSSTLIQFKESDGNPSTVPLEGLTEWVAYSADGEQIPLVLELERRVRVEVIPAEGCPEDVNGDGVVDVLDLLAVIAAWGNPGGPEDINGDGIVNVLDLLAVISAWGPC